MFNFLSNLSVKFNSMIIWIIFFFNILPLSNVSLNPLLLIIVWVICYYLFVSSKNNSLFQFNYLYIYMSYVSSIVLNRWFFFYFLSKFNLMLNKILSLNLLTFKKFNLLNYKWNPLIKQYSYYGYFKSNQPRWTFSYTDEMKNYKF